MIWNLGKFSNILGKENQIEALALIGQFLGGFGLFLLGVAVIWFVSANTKKKE